MRQSVREAIVRLWSSRWGRLSVLFVGMVGVMVAVMLFARPDDGQRAQWNPFSARSDRASLNPGDSSSDDHGLTVGRTIAPVVTGGEDGVRDGAPGSTGTRGLGSNAQASGSSEAEAKEPPAGTNQPQPPVDPVTHLDRVFGESMFPEALPGLKQILVSDVDELEFTATYKSEDSTMCEVLRITVHQAESSTAAQRQRDAVLGLYSVQSIEYPWGGRGVAQAFGTPDGANGEPPVVLCWLQGRYAVDVIAYSPYPGGIDRARNELLDLVGTLPF